MSSAESVLDLESQKKRWEKYRAELIAHYGGEIDAAKKLYAIFAPVFFAVSLAFLKDMVDWQAADYKWVVYTSWGCFVLVIALTLISHLLSAEQALKQLHLYDDHFNRTNKMLDAEPNSPGYLKSSRLLGRNDRWLRFLRYASAVLFLSALVLLIVFIGLNNA